MVIFIAHMQVPFPIVFFGTFANQRFFEGPLESKWCVAGCVLLTIQSSGWISMDKITTIHSWLVVSTHLKNKYARQIGSFPQIGVKMKTI